MIAAFRERRLRLARWSASFAALSVSVLVIAAIVHRVRLIDAAATYGALAASFLLAGVAVLTAVAAFAKLWRYGGSGGGAAARGLVIGLIVLSIPAVAAWQVVAYPRLNDISTDPNNPPAFQRALADRDPGDAAPRRADDAEIALQRDAYPDIVPRHYPATAVRVFQEAAAIVTARGWDVLDLRPPGEADASGRIEAVATTLLFAFRQDVIVVVVPDGDGALVEMRSASRTPVHDLGVNARRIRAFFADLDDALRGITG